VRNSLSHTCALSTIPIGHRRRWDHTTDDRTVSGRRGHQTEQEWLKNRFWKFIAEDLTLYRVLSLKSFRRGRDKERSIRPPTRVYFSKPVGGAHSIVVTCVVHFYAINDPSGNYRNRILCAVRAKIERNPFAAMWSFFSFVSDLSLFFSLPILLLLLSILFRMPFLRGCRHNACKKKTQSVSILVI
jgi:hypothetical protein